jgi:hypothetical protein
MKRVMMLAIATSIGGLFSCPSYAEGERQTGQGWQQLTPQLRIGGSVRLRYESKQNFGFGAATAGNTQDYWLHQLRLNLNWQPNSHVSLFIEGQDARIHKASRPHNINNIKTPNIFEDHFDLHQGYVDFKIAEGDVSSRLRLGRQKLNIGALRMIASLEWVNTARVWDGIRSTTNIGKAHTIDAFATRLVPVNPLKLNNHDRTGSRLFNSGFHGIYYTNRGLIEHLQTEVYGLLRYEPVVADRIYTLGLRMAYTPGRWDTDAEFMGQTGTFGGLQHRAYALHVGAGYKIKPVRTHLGLAYNFGSGDSNPADNKHQTFDNMYPLNHAYYGFMDFFSLQNVHNLEVVAKTKLYAGLVLRSAWQGFWLAKPDSDSWYNAGAGVVRTAAFPLSSHVGDEVDITLIYKIPGHKAKVVAGYSHFFTGNYIKRTGTSKDADFVFVQTKLNF